MWEGVDILESWSQTSVSPTVGIYGVIALVGPIGWLVFDGSGRDMFTGRKQ